MRNALVALMLVASTAFSLAEDRVRVGDCSVIASYLEDQITSADTDNPFHSEEICYRWQVRTTCNVQMRFDYRFRRIRGGDVSVKSGTISKGSLKSFCGPGGDSERFFVE